jgi:hypothetical protein
MLASVADGACQAKSQFHPYFESISIMGGPSYVSLRPFVAPTTTAHAVSQWGFSLGLEVSYRIGQKFSVVSRVFYERKGDRHLDAIQVFDQSTNKTVLVADGYELQNIYQCVTIPVTGRYYVGHQSNLWVDAGLFLSHKIKFSILSNSVVANVRTVIDYTEYIKNEDAGVVFGFGGKTRVWKLGNLSFNVLSVLGLRNIINVDATQKIFNVESTWKTFSLSAQIGIPIRTKTY